MEDELIKVGGAIVGMFVVAGAYFLRPVKKNKVEPPKVRGRIYGGDNEQ